MSFFESGSSPLTRGKPPMTQAAPGDLGLIPAHAGKTRRATKRVARSKAHPRSRGENGQASAAYFAARGSSPLTRGKLGCPIPPAARGGLIPAHAGKTALEKNGAYTGKAHPRSRGENRRERHTRSNGAGSSPLTRGKPRHWRAHHRPPRLIPAHAGKTAAWDITADGFTAHPRSRGENRYRP